MMLDERERERERVRMETLRARAEPALDMDLPRGTDICFSGVGGGLGKLTLFLDLITLYVAYDSGKDFKILPAVLSHLRARRTLGFTGRRRPVSSSGSALKYLLVATGNIKIVISESEFIAKLKVGWAVTLIAQPWHPSSSIPQASFSPTRILI